VPKSDTLARARKPQKSLKEKNLLGPAYPKVHLGYFSVLIDGNVIVKRFS
jgi:hypothetical protein